MMLSREKTCSKSDRNKLLESMRRYFSDGLYFAIRSAFDNCENQGRIERIEEIRLRRDRRMYFTVGGFGRKKNIATDIILSGEELTHIFNRMCDGSLYAYSESIIKGYVTLPFGVRVGVCGRAATEKDRIFGIHDISGLNIRIPSVDARVDVNLLNLIKNNLSLGQGVLIFSPPAQGKTTCLRAIAYALASGMEPLRVCVVDSRQELGLMSENKDLSMDILSGYPKADGIRMATLFMNPEVIICDEIGSDEEAMAISNAQNCGVPLIATTHGAALSSVMLKKGIATLHKACAFGCYISLRIAQNGAFSYSYYTYEEAEKALEDNGRSDNSI